MFSFQIFQACCNQAMIRKINIRSFDVSSVDHEELQVQFCNYCLYSAMQVMEISNYFGIEIFQMLTSLNDARPSRIINILLFLVSFNI